MSHCITCGAVLPSGAEFCPRCGNRVAPVVPQPPQATSAVPQQPASKALWIVPLVLLALVGVIWLLLSGLPFRKEERVVANRVPTETIAEAKGPAQTATLIEVAGAADDSFDTVSSDEAPNTTTVDPPPPVIVEDEPAPRPDPPRDSVPPRKVAPPRESVPPREAAPLPVPAPRREEPAGEITAGEAESILRGYVTSSNYYRMERSCLRIQNRGYRNAGYALEVWESCAGGASRLRGRWRVDAKTREVFVRRDDGRYLKP